MLRRFPPKVEHVPPTLFGGAPKNEVEMLLAIDIGNTNITLGLFRISQGTAMPRPVKVWRLITNKYKTAREYVKKISGLFRQDKIKLSKVEAVAVASVVPGLDRIFKDISSKYLGKKPFFVVPGRSKFKMKYDNPSEVGADRIANAVGAYHFFKKPAIIIDFGTATTFDCVDSGGFYLGGAIAPGPLISAESLVLKTAKLPLVKMAKPRRVIGKSTVKCIQAGLFFGYVGLIKEIFKRIRSEMKSNPVIIATGGLAGIMVPEIKEVNKVLPDLTLEGIRIIWNERDKR